RGRVVAPAGNITPTGTLVPSAIVTSLPLPDRTGQVLRLTSSHPDQRVSPSNSSEAQEITWSTVWLLCGFANIVGIVPPL
ncbi:MAG TPA: hypothetical protein VGL95_03070, partial [Acetobacteraceae bacterium]